MKKITAALLIAGLLVLAWSAVDFYQLFTTWQKAFQHYAGTNTEESVLALGRLTLENGLVKAGIGALMVGTAGYRIQKEKGTN